MAEHRVVSLIASATEIVAALGCEDQLVGRSHECDYPPSVRHLPICSEPKFDVEGVSYEIDQRVKAILQESLAVYRVHADVLQELKPDLIITQTQCDVCAVTPRDVEAALCQLVDSHPQLVELEPISLADIWRNIQRVADALDVPERGRELIARLQGRLNAIEERSAPLPHRPTVACIEWIDPLMAGGNWMPTLVRIAGGRNLFGVENQHSPWMQWDDLVQADPEVIVVLPCGWDISKCRSEMTPLVEKPEWNSLRAVRDRRVFLTDGNQFFNRPGPRLVESAEILAEIVHPEVFSFDHEGAAWVRFDD